MKKKLLGIALVAALVLSCATNFLSSKQYAGNDPGTPTPLVITAYETNGSDPGTPTPL